MIPKIIHQIWIGKKPMSNECWGFIDQWKHMYPDYRHIFWNTEIGIIPQSKYNYFTSEYPIALQADILRYEIILRFGGIYVDVDTEPLKKLENSVLDCKFFSGEQPNGQINIAIFGAEPYSELMKDVCASVDSNITDKLNGGCKMEYVDQLTGPEFFTRKCNPYLKTSGYHFYAPKYFYPYNFDEMHRRHEDFKTTSPEAYSVHHWQKNWL